MQKAAPGGLLFCSLSRKRDGGWGFLRYLQDNAIATLPQDITRRRKDARRAKTRFRAPAQANMSDAEQKLWQCLRGRQLAGFRFRRQHPVGPYIADFACLEKHSLIEVDGGQHNGSQTDVHREAFLRGKGFAVVRFWNNDVLENLEGVCDVILRHLGDTHPPSRPSPRKRGKEKRKALSRLRERFG
jgi:very-short-patch-repair endonuclease